LYSRWLAWLAVALVLGSSSGCSLLGGGGGATGFDSMFGAGPLAEMIKALGPMVDPTTGAVVTPKPIDVKVKFEAQHANFLPVLGESMFILVGEGRRTYRVVCEGGKCDDATVRTSTGAVALWAIWAVDGGEGKLLGPVHLYREGDSWRGVLVIP